MNNNNYCIIMAGGVGSRFWPLSRSSKPKQFLDILGLGRTLFQQTFDRFVQIIPQENIYVVTTSAYLRLVRDQLPELTSNQILIEPYRRNTAPCIAYATYKIKTLNPAAKLVVAPSDHLIMNLDEFLNTVEAGFDYVEKNDSLLTLGIKPQSPETAYGYIQIDLEDPLSSNLVKKVKTFTEKPNLELAKVFYESGDFYWNSGIFLWSANSILRAFSRFLPDIDDLFQRNSQVLNTSAENEAIKRIYAECRSISIDYGIMEKADNVGVISSNFGWSDLGSWNALFENTYKDKNNNTIVGSRVITEGTSNCIVNLSESKLVVLQGLDNYIIVESDGVLLVCKKDQEEKIRMIVNDIKLQHGEEFV